MPLISARVLSVAAAAAVTTAASTVAADVIHLPAVRDNTLYDSPAGLLSNGAGQHFFAGTNAGLAARRGLIMFDIAGTLPADATITSVTLTLHMSRDSGGLAAVSLHRLLADWGEGTTDAEGNEGGGGPATPGSATWLHRFHDTVLWATPGGDFVATPSAAQSIGAEGFYSWSSVSMVADVQAWLAGDSPNFGWAMLGDEASASTAKRFDSRENPIPELRPVLMVQYIPAPATTAVALLALAAGHRRRRKAT